MNKNSQYESDMKFIERYEKMVTVSAENIFYYIVLFACLAVHILYLVLFIHYGIKEMAIFNIFSILFYVATVILVSNVKDKLILINFALAEIILNAAVATVYVGWKPDFGMFLLMIIPVGFILPNKKKSVAFVFMFISLLLYGVLRFTLADADSTRYNLENESAGNVLYIINISVGTFVLIYFTILYSFYNRYIESKLRVHNEQLKKIASIDPLTQLSNRRAMGEALKKICLMSRQMQTPYVIGIGDIDNFKRVNDTYGHDFGDTVLVTVAEIITENVPEGGCVARWGGEEFLFVIPNTDINGGFECAQKIVRAVSRYEFMNEGESFSVTMTFGVCEGKPDDDVDKIIICADQRLYKGKNSGKNHTEYTD